ncbi:LysR family transcriptional regulator [Thiolinea disciformis]|uniref:LysR family transcriptional regulator n=1 Tax=Thiolinea disciformis TaxID=125614 RepID=UPI000380F780|nr:LysR family transcriptional regulator [Thiolinea disciformis]
MRQMQIFQTVAQTESFTRAAEILHMTQPAISMQVKQLEEQVGLALFERRGKRMALSMAGRSMQTFTGEILTQYQSLIESLEELKNVHHGHIRLSAANTAVYFVTHLLAAFSRQYTGITVSLTMTNRQALIESLHNYTADLVIMGEPPAHLELHSQRLMPNPLVLIAPPQHKLARRKTIHFAEILTERFVVREQGSGTRLAIERFFNEQGHTFTSTLEMGSNESIKCAVVAGLGLGIVSLHSIQMELAAKALVILPLEHFPLQRYWHIVTRAGKALSPAAQAFRDYVVSEATHYSDKTTL